jgi:hypothetical protein
VRFGRGLVRDQVVAGSLCERPKYSDKDPRGGTDQSANKQNGERCRALSGQCQPQCRPRKRQEFVNELHRARSWNSATGSTPPLD